MQWAFRDRQVSDRIQLGGGAADDGTGLPLLERVAEPLRNEPLNGPLIRSADFPDGPATFATYATCATCAIDGNDPQRSLLPLLLQRLSPLQRRLLWHRYLREHPLNPPRIERVLGLPAAEQARLEEEALRVLRRVAQEYGGL